MKISVIMLTYNREAFISHAMESVIAQTFRDFEFIIVDNGSTDRSGVIADRYAEKDCRIRVIHRNRGSIGSGRNTGLDAAKGEYIAFIDDDDWCEPDYLDFLYKNMTENNASIAICGAFKEEQGEHSTVGIEEMAVFSAEEAIIELMWRKRFNNGFPTKLFKRSLFEVLRFPKTGRYDDIHLMYKVLAGAQRVVSYGLPKYHVYRHEGNNSIATTKDGMITRQYIDDYRSAYRQRTEWLCEHFPGQTAYWWYFDWSFALSMIHKIIANNLMDCQVHLENMRRELMTHRKDFLNSPYALEHEKELLQIYVKAL